MSESPVEVLLATYNGEKYLSEQIDSILAQTYQNIRLLIRDDGSTDSTLNIIQHYIEKYPEKITLINSKTQRSGPIQNFSNLISASTAPYILLSDQDDIWIREKISLLVNAIQALEHIHSANTPVLVHSDLTVVDHSLNLINPSFWKYIGINPARDSFENLLVQNIVTGCASIFNRALAHLCAPIPPQARMHDWWLGLVASSMGILEKVDQPTVLYRQHPANTLGAKQFSWKLSYLLEKLALILKPEEEYFLTEYLIQAEGFYDRFKLQLPQPMLRKLEVFKEIKNQGYLGKRITILRNGFTKAKLIQTIGLLLSI